MSRNEADWYIRSVLIAVRSLDRSIAFYRDVMSLELLARSGEVAILGEGTPRSGALILREVAGTATRHGQQALGARAVCFNLDTQAALDRVEERLGALGGSPTRRGLSEDDPLELVHGRDPDGFPIVFLSFEGFESLDAHHYRNVVMNMYGLDV